MSGTDAPARPPRRAIWVRPISLAIGAVLVLALWWTVRQIWVPGFANAQGSALPNQPTSTSGADRAPGGARQPASQTVPKIPVVAVVNGEQISRQQLAQECLRRYGADVLESLVNKQLILNACQRRGIVITQKDIDEEIQRLAGKFGLSADRWVQMLHQERSISPEQYGRDIVWPTLALKHLAVSDLRVTPEEIQQGLASELGPRVQVRLISVSKQDKANEVRSLAIADSASFAKLAREHSEDTNSASVGGLILPIRKHVGDPTIETAAFSLKEGEISPVIHVANQFLILKCEKHLPPTVLGPQQRQDAENRIVEHLREKKLRDIASQIFKQLQDEAQVVIVHGTPELEQRLPGVAATINGAPMTLLQLAEECIVRHGNEVLNGEINRLLITQALKRRHLTVEGADLDQEIARAADSYGFLKLDRTPDIERWLEHVIQTDGGTVDLYVRDAVWPSVALKKLVGANVQVTEEDLQKGFEANYGPRVEVLAIVLNNQRSANQVWNMAKSNPTEQFFGELAQQYSIEPISQANFGKVPPIQRHGGRPTLEKAAFELQPGELSGLINIDDKWIILYCLGRTTQIVKEMDQEIRRELHNDIHEKVMRLEMAKQFDELKESAQIDNFLAGTSQSGKHAASAALPDNAIRSRVPFARDTSR